MSRLINKLHAPRLLCFGLLMVLPLSLAEAHFPWLEIENRNTAEPVLQCYFSEAPVADSAELLKYVTDAQIWELASRKEPQQVSLVLSDDGLLKSLSETEAESLYLLKKTLGVRAKGDAPFLLHYYSKTGPTLNSWAWSSKTSSEILGLDVRPELDGGQLTLTVLFQNDPVTGAEVVLMNDLAPVGEAVMTNEKGQIHHDLQSSPLHAVRVKFIENKSGEYEEKAYSEIRHYLTVTFPVTTYRPLVADSTYAEIPETVTSFGAAVLNDQLYFYGGHTGDAHSYSIAGQSECLWSLDLKAGKTWQKVATGPKLQGLAMVAVNNKLYRIGGFTAKNAEGEDHDLWSQNSFAEFDPATSVWKELPPLPEARSSFDAAVLDGKIYVVGGWALEGAGENQWHTTAWSFDPAADQPQWTALATAPFERRALSVAAFAGKLFVIGGMQSAGNPTTRTAIYHPQTNEWTEGPRLQGNAMNGFGSSAFAVNGKLYVSTYDGSLQVLTADEKSWETLGQLENARFFHRMLPYKENGLIFLGGSNMQIGKFSEVEVVKVNAQ